MMILANVRQHLTRDDAQLAVRLIARGSSDAIEEAETTLREQGFDALLDDPRLLAGLMVSRQGSHASFPLFAYVVVRHALRDVGEGDRVLADYVASILLHFGLGSRASRVGESDDEVYSTLAELSGALESADPQRSFLVRAHLGNYALWMSGVFPDYIELRRWRRGGPDLDYYEEMGRRGFTLAADHRLAAQHGLTALFEAAAARFPVLRQALNNVSDALLFPHHHSPEKLMRQVQVERKWMLT
jgi:hypothetical protein